MSKAAALKSLPSGQRSVVNLSGFNPLEFCLLVRPREVDPITKGGIIRPDINKEREQAAAIEGEIVAVSPVAFTYERFPDGFELPKPGTKVVFAKYAGMRWRSEQDGVEYLIVKDKDVCGYLD